MKEYKNRIADEILKKLKGKGAVLIQGPKWCGKTTTAEQISKRILYMVKSDEQEQNKTLADINPSLLLKGDIPRLIDEWQIAPKLWDVARYEIDHRNAEGQFIFTGSSVPANMDNIIHTGTGRFAWLLMRPMTLYESGESTGEVSLKDLFEGKEKIQGINKLELEEIAFLVCRGGWPRSVYMEEDVALEQAFDCYKAVVETDISKVDNVSKNPERVKRLMRAYARNLGTQVSNETLKKDMLVNDSQSLDTDTVLAYVNALKKIL